LKGKKFKIVIGFILMISIGLLFVLILYNKPLSDIKKSKADITLSAQDLIDDYSKDELLADKKYVNNIIEIKGDIFKITADNGNSIIAFKNINGESSVLCHMLPEENLNVLKLKKNNPVIIKGICTGYLLDVIMVRCVLVNN